jgi:S1/P1 nuclease
MRAIVVLLVLTVLWPVDCAFAWWDEGHMQIAYVAYKKLNPAVRERADVLLRLNPDYAHWTAGAPAGQEKLYAFVHAATWADDIKTKPDYYDDQVTDSTAKENVPYGHLKHSYWHYRDTLFGRQHAFASTRSRRRRHPAQADDRQGPGVVRRLGYASVLRSHLDHPPRG